ncbi:unnamed protein product [Pleuronectes platessa]|uniref:Consortin C-terminal domain-containing protein n=1 Tax=Pleuronectes platessa TaxID=8262 RepID=A0A9N7W3Z6_PLEPL|nr:unnamed protein product [Pleuronectes platessa]
MSQLPVDGVDLCDNLPNPEAAQTQNLNETNILTQIPSLCPSQIAEGGGRRLFQKPSLNNNGKDKEEEQGNERYTGRGRAEDEEEDNDEVMKEEEEEEVSEESSSLIRGQSPDTMTDSSFSETGSLLETPYPFSPGTSADSTSPVIPVVSPETAYPISPVEFNLISTCSTGTIPSPALLKYLEQLAQKGDDGHLPHYLHQIAEAFVLQKDYQEALWCIQLERLYHQRILDNLNTIQEHWESQCKMTSSDLASEHLDTLKHICQTHSRPSSRDAVRASLDSLRPTVEEGAALFSSFSADQVDRGTEQRDNDSFPQSGDPVTPSINLTDRLSLPEIVDKDSEDPDRALDGRDGFHGSQLTYEQGSDRERGEAEGGLGHTIPAIENDLHPSTAGEMDQSKPAEQQGGDLGLAEGKEVKREEEERSVEEAAEALEMDDEGEEDDKEKQKKKDVAFYQRALPVDNLGSGAEVEEEQLQQEVPAEERLHEHTQQESTKTCLHQEVHLTQEAHVKQQEQHEEEEEEEEEYEVEQADLIREAAPLDDMAKLITVEEMSPASGLVSILKKRRVCVDNVSVSSSSETWPDKPTAKRRVRFRVPDDEEQDVGGGDSCLLLFLLCLVTVVISVGGTALYCALGDAHSSVCHDFSRNADFYFGQIQRGITHMQHWFTPGS